jgi:hypothetical protein
MYSRIHSSSGDRDLTQSLTHCRQVLYHCATSPAFVQLFNGRLVFIALNIWDVITLKNIHWY